MEYRWYSAELGRFLSRDPIGHAGGLNLYEYADSNPSTIVDPLGLFVLEGLTTEAVIAIAEAIVADAVAASATTAAADGPLPFGDTVAAGVLAGAGVTSTGLILIAALKDGKNKKRQFGGSPRSIRKVVNKKLKRKTKRKGPPGGFEIYERYCNKDEADFTKEKGVLRTARSGKKWIAELGVQDRNRLGSGGSRPTHHLIIVARPQTRLWLNIPANAKTKVHEPGRYGIYNSRLATFNARKLIKVFVEKI